MLNGLGKKRHRRYIKIIKQGVIYRPKDLCVCCYCHSLCVVFPPLVFALPLGSEQKEIVRADGY